MNDRHKQSMAELVAPKDGWDFARTLERELAEAREELARVKAMNARLGTMVDKLLNHCDKESGECSRCSEIVCPHECDMHFHHDGCPACAELGDGEPLHPAHPEPLTRPDKPGWWWEWVDYDRQYVVTFVRNPEREETGHWLPATPPPAPTGEGEGLTRLSRHYGACLVYQ